MKKTIIAFGIFYGMASLLGGCASDPAKVTTAPVPAKAQAQEKEPASPSHRAEPFSPTSE